MDHIPINWQGVGAGATTHKAGARIRPRPGEGVMRSAPVADQEPTQEMLAFTTTLEALVWVATTACSGDGFFEERIRDDSERFILMHDPL